MPPQLARGLEHQFAGVTVSVLAALYRDAGAGLYPGQQLRESGTLAHGLAIRAWLGVDHPHVAATWPDVVAAQVFGIAEPAVAAVEEQTHPLQRTAQFGHDVGGRGQLARLVRLD